jgi:putative ABC transport system permease protein
MLKIENLTKHYKSRKKTVIAIDCVNLEFHKGEFVSILGLSGSGKTTLVSQIGGMDNPTEGRLIINGIDTSTYSTSDWTNYRLNNIGFIFQDFNLISHLTAKENIEIALSLSGKKSAERSARSEELLTMMGLHDRMDQLPSELSGGEQQRVAIARALANEPDIILADEPTGALDPDTSVQIMSILQELARNGHLVIMVTHNKYLAKAYSTKIVELSGGKVIREEQLESPTNQIEKKTATTKSSLEIQAAFKIAFNNLKIRKRSTIFTLISLVPSMILIFSLINFVFNLSDYEKDFRPITNAVINDDSNLYLTPKEDEVLDSEIKEILKHITSRQYNYDATDAYLGTIVNPYSTVDIEQIESIKGVDKILKPMMFNVEIDHIEFVLMTLPPKAYSNHQYAIPENLYPVDNAQGVIMSTEAIRRLKGKYTEDVQSVKGENLNMALRGINGFALKRSVYQQERDEFTLSIDEVIEVEAKTTLIENYYAGYIFVPYELGKSLYEAYSTSDLTLIATRLPDPMSGETDLIVIGPQYVKDMLKPLREMTSLQENYDLFKFKKYSFTMPSNNFSVKHQMIINDQFNEMSQKALEVYGTVYRSAYDDMTVESAIETGRYIRFSIWGATALAGVIVLIPSLLLCVILYISIMNRVKEIGILKSVGARNRDIIYIFVIEAGLISLTGSVFGLLLSFPVIRYLQKLLETQYQISFYLGSNPMRYNIPGLIFASITSFLLVTSFGLLPGRKASKLQPSRLLKHIN